MPRTINITVPSSETDTLVDEIQHLDGVLGLRVQRNISLQPPGDVVEIEMMTTAQPPLMRVLRDRGLGRRSAYSMTSSFPASLISPTARDEVALDVSEATWEEMEMVIGRESNMTPNGMMIMAIGGVIAAIGIATNALHVVVGAMLIAPGFEPISRIALGIVARRSSWRYGLTHTAKAYAVLVASAAVTALVLRALGTPPLSGEPSYLPAGVLVSYWTTITATSLIVTAAASAGGALLIAANRSILTGGVMIALALIPSATIVGMALVLAEWDVMIRALMRWLIELGSVTFFSLLVFLWKRSRVHQRDMMF